MFATSPNRSLAQPSAPASTASTSLAEASVVTLPDELQAKIVQKLDPVAQARLAAVHRTLSLVVAAAAAQRDWAQQLRGDQIAAPAQPIAPAQPAALAQPPASAELAPPAPAATPVPDFDAQRQAANQREKRAYTDFYAGSVASHRELCNTACYETLARKLPALVPTLSRQYAAVPVAQHILGVCLSAFGHKGEARSPRLVAEEAARNVSEQLEVLLQAIEDPVVRAKMRRQRATINDPTVGVPRPYQAPGAPRRRPRADRPFPQP